MDADVNASLTAPIRHREPRLIPIVLDPPKFAPTVNHAEQAARLTKTSTVWLFKLLEPGASCSPTLFGRHQPGPVSKIASHKHRAGWMAITGADGRCARPPMTIDFPEGGCRKDLVSCTEAIVLASTLHASRVRIPAGRTTGQQATVMLITMAAPIEK
jgi:23S rRNA (cytosine1962-C5)-methyltransferase